MKAKSRMPQRSGSPISIALETFGDSWSLLVIRDLMFKGLHTFNQFLATGEGIGSHFLSDRPRETRGRGHSHQAPYPADARRYNYRLTEKGIDLAPALVEIVLRAARHEDTEAPTTTLRQMRTHRE